jgi:hypothetical protein
MKFQDYFSEQAAGYARHRPGYPPKLFAWLAEMAPAQQAAWDSGTGSGQAARALAAYFQRVIATDASPEQIQHAPAHERVEYRVERAEATSIKAHSIDLITAAVAVHWYDFEAYYREVRRVGRPQAVIAVWTYQFAEIDPAIDRLVKRFYFEILAGNWPERIHYVEEKYQTLPFPFTELAAPAFKLEARWDLAALAGFLDSWSAVRRFQKEKDVHPLDEIWPELLATWGDPEHPRQIVWPLYLRVGRVGP